MRAVIHTWSNHMVINSGRINGSLTLCDMGQKGSLPPPPSTIRSFVRPTYSYILIALSFYACCYCYSLVSFGLYCDGPLLSLPFSPR